MLDNLSEKFTKVFRYLKGEAKITEENIKEALREIKLSLLEADVNFKVVKKFIENIREKSLGKEVQDSLTPHQQVIKIVKSELEVLLGSDYKELSQSGTKPSVVMLVGLQGTGKTTTAGKLALHLKENGKSPLLCSLDLKRLAAGEQLETIANEVGVNYFKAEPTHLKKIVKQLMANAREYGYDYVLVDTAGRLHIDDDLMTELKQIKAALNPVEVIFVADSLTGQDAVNSALTFSEKIEIDSIILTKLDADARGGAALSIVSVTGKPIKFVGVGEKNKDFQKFYPDRMASQILGMGDVLTLIEKAEEKFDQKQAEKVARKMLRDEFTLDDFLSQLQQVQKLGSLSDIMEMMPNMAPNFGVNPHSNKAQVDDNKIKYLVAIINSMTIKEREKPKIINGRRRLRIARGSGRQVQEVNQLLKQYFEIKKVMKKPFFRKMLRKFDFLSKMR
ncbi:MAG: signal recognition particle protein [Candidatus Aminicenantes bacterium]|nr:signal recognition particle protein [Candidatus Aminicenantes bacterium]